MALLAMIVIVDGLAGPQLSPMNLAGVLPWIHWRGLLILSLLVAGQCFLHGMSLHVAAHGRPSLAARRPALAAMAPQ